MWGMAVGTSPYGGGRYWQCRALGQRHPRTGPPAAASLDRQTAGHTDMGLAVAPGSRQGHKVLQNFGKRSPQTPPSRAAPGGQGWDGRCCPRAALRGHCTRTPGGAGTEHLPKTKTIKQCSSDTSSALLRTPFSGSLLTMAVICHSLKSKYNAILIACGWNPYNWNYSFHICF